MASSASTPSTKKLLFVGTNLKLPTPEFFSGIKQFIVRYTVRVLTYRPLANGTTPDLPNYANIAPFFLEETFP